jgi:glucoselysine-6-phosphate deglycase
MADMYRYCRSQASCLRDLLARRKEIAGGFGCFCSAMKPDRVYLVGSGSSLNACKSARRYMEKALEIEVTAFAPSDPPPLRGTNPLVLIVSQSGRSTNTAAYTRSLRERGYKVASFTAGLDVPVAKTADFAVDISVGDETVGPKTRGYTGTVLCLYLAALEASLARNSIDQTVYDHKIELLAETIGYSEENLDACEAFYREHMDDLRTARHYLFVGKGTAGAVGEECALKVLETLCFPSAGYEFEEYLHGPACCTSPQTALFLFNSGDGDTPRMLKMADVTSQASVNSYVVDRTGKLRGERVLSLKTADCPYMSPFADIFLAQIISALLTQELAIVRHPAVRTVFAAMDTKIQDTPAKP